MSKRQLVFGLTAFIALLFSLSNALFSSGIPVDAAAQGLQAQPAPTEVARADSPPPEIYFAPQQDVALELPGSLRAPEQTTLLVGVNTAEGGTLEHLSTDFELLGKTELGTTQRLTIDQQGDLYAGYGDPAQLRVITSTCRVENDPALPAAVDYEIGGPGGVVNAEGIEVIDPLAITLIADSNPEMPMIAVFGKLATGETIIGLRMTELAGKRPTDLSYDTVNDRLYVSTMDGAILVFDDFSVYYGVQGPDQVIIPFDPAGNGQATRNLHSLTYVPAIDTLFLTDIGESGDADDGQVLVINRASQRTGNSPVSLQITGAPTLLRDPADLAFDGSSLYVAEPVEGAVLRFDNVLSKIGTRPLVPDASSPAPDVHSVVVVLMRDAASADCAFVALAAQTPTVAGGAELLTQVPPIQATSAASTDQPAQSTSVPPTGVPSTSVPATSVPPTAIPPTSVPPTQVPPTSVPPTAIPPTQVPPTPIPPTAVPPTQVPPTDEPPPEPTFIIPLPTIEIIVTLPGIDLGEDGNSGHGSGNSGQGNNNGGGNSGHGGGDD